MLDRRGFLALALALAVAPARAARGAVETRQEAFAADAGILYGALSFQVTGTIDETVDRPGSRYAVRIRGQGSGITHSLDASGLLLEDRWAPVRTNSLFLVHGRESRLSIAYDYDQRIIEYHSRSETFFLRRRRVADDVLPMPPDARVDDALSAVLNYADERWPPQPDGTLRTQVVRRRRPTGEGPDDVERRYRAELVPFVLQLAAEPETGRATALFDLTRFSSWARVDRPARIVFGAHRRPEAITSSLVLGTSFSIRIANP
jgi:hypothetical protein